MRPRRNDAGCLAVRVIAHAYAGVRFGEDGRERWLLGARGGYEREDRGATVTRCLRPAAVPGRPAVPRRAAAALLAATAAAAALAGLAAPASAAPPGRAYFPSSCGLVGGPTWRFSDGSGRAWLLQATIPCARARRLAAARVGRLGPLPAPPGWRCEGQPYAGACFRLTRHALAVVDWTVAHDLDG